MRLNVFGLPSPDAKRHLQNIPIYNRSVQVLELRQIFVVFLIQEGCKSGF